MTVLAEPRGGFTVLESPTVMYCLNEGKNNDIASIDVSVMVPQNP